ncbi:hypothetical protein M9Y10_022976 [Tritrichomonas musculus]|uniref:protein-serine/threonine phosphatase n=1 Tax=Tritrichomonas musculus TaxID=1915356 RepID=A0ABR2KVP6_9EUKA
MTNSQYVNDNLKRINSNPPEEPTEEAFIALCQAFQKRYSTLSNLLEIKQLVTIVGSVHAQFDDILEMFDVCGHTPYTSYLFLGNFVNYGNRNISTVTLLFSLALKYPRYFYLLRGPHESRKMTRECGLYSELINLYGTPRAWEALMDAFDSLPLAARVCGQLLCLSGGIGRNILTLSQIDSFNRFMEIPTTESWSSLMWNIPNASVKDFTAIDKGIGSYYGKEQFDAFLKANDLSTIVYSRRLCQNGYDSTLFDGKCICIWSAPNFLNWGQNDAAVLQIVSLKAEFKNSFNLIPFRAKPESERLPENRPKIQNVSVLDHVYFKNAK